MMSDYRWLILFLYLNDQESVNGRIKLMKEMFLCKEEITELMQYDFYNFEPSVHGPVSHNFEQDINFCFSKNLMESKKKVKKSENVTILEEILSITEKGSEEIEPFLNEIDINVVHRLERLKRVYNSFSLPFILLHIHTKYPQYRIYRFSQR